MQSKIGVGVLVWKDKKLLLGKRINKDKIDKDRINRNRIKKWQSYCWQFPGGHLENNESIIECARREVLEETSLQIKQLRHLGFTDKPFEIDKKQYITLLVSSEYESGVPKALEPDKCESWQWFDYRDLPSPLFLPITLFLEQQAALTANAKDLYALHCAAK
jgi:8-oxo-dGTP diphosphatase